MRKFTFEKVEDTFYSLNFAFSDENNEYIPDEDYDRFRSVFVVFLTMAGWDEDEFFTTLNENEPLCENCGENHPDDDLDGTDDVLPAGDSSMHDKKHNLN